MKQPSRSDEAAETGIVLKNIVPAGLDGATDVAGYNFENESGLLISLQTKTAKIFSSLFLLNAY